jgi:integrase
MPKLKHAPIGYVREVETKRQGTRFQPGYKLHGTLHTGGTFATWKEANEWLKDEAATIHGNALHDPTGAKRMFREVSDAWLESNPNKSGSAHIRDSKILENDILPTLKDQAIGKITADQVQRIVNEWIDSKTPGGQPLAGSTVWRKFAVLAAVFAFAVDRHWLLASPAIPNNHTRTGGINLPARPSSLKPKVRHELTAAEVAKIEAACSAQLSVFARIGAAAGLRMNQILGLQVKNLDLEVGTIHPTQGVTIGEVDGKIRPTLSKPGSSKAPDHEVSIDPDTVERLRVRCSTD